MPFGTKNAKSFICDVIMLFHNLKVKVGSVQKKKKKNSNECMWSTVPVHMLKVYSVFSGNGEKSCKLSALEVKMWLPMNVSIFACLIFWGDRQ